MNQNEMLDKAKEVLSIEQDQELAAALGVHQSTISKVRSGRNNLGPEIALKLAEILKIPPEKVAAAAYAARATSRRDKDRWEKAAALALVLAITATGPESRALADMVNIMRSTGGRSGRSPTQSATSIADTPRNNNDGGKAREIQRGCNRITVGELARRVGDAGRNPDTCRKKNRPAKSRLAVMESGILRPRAPRGLRFALCPALRPRRVSASQMCRLGLAGRGRADPTRGAGR